VYGKLRVLYGDACASSHESRDAAVRFGDERRRFLHRSLQVNHARLNCLCYTRTSLILICSGGCAGFEVAGCIGTQVVACQWADDGERLWWLIAFDCVWLCVITGDDWFGASYVLHDA